MNFGILALGFTTGLVTSLHCLGMCGPLVIAVGQAGGAPSGAGWAVRAALWNLGRGVALSAVAFGAGAAGGTLATRGGAAVVTLVAGVVTVLVALGLAGWLPIPASWRARTEGLGSRVFGRLFGRFGVLGAFAIGCATILLPCGPLYAVWTQAAALGPWGGLALAAAFWAGTVPALAALAAGGGVLFPRIRRFARPLAAGAVGVAGIMLVFRGVKVLLALRDAGCCHSG
jgi:uncharacterized protein